MNTPTMNKFLSTSVCFLLITTQLFAQKLPNKKEVLKALKLTNAYFMNKWPDAGKSIITNRERPSNIWTRAVYYEGLMGLYSIHPDKAYYDYAVQWGEKHKWGLRNGIQTRNGDDQACGQTYIDLYNIDKKPERIKDIKASMDLMVQSGKVNDWTWIDALQMAMPVFAKLGKLYNDHTYYDYMYKMYLHSKNVEGGGLYNAKDGLWWRDKDFVPPYKEPNGEDCYWARGNGWVIAAFVRVLETMPKDAAGHDEYLKTYHEMIKALVPLQRADGFWNVSLHDPNHFGGKETSGTALFVYGMAWGVNQGILDKATYLPVIIKAWNGMAKESVQKNGFLGFLQGTGKEPKDGQPVTYTSVPDFEDYGIGCFLLAGTEVYKLKK
ncbi:glycoside hydrolase family 88 protein [Pedobacter frigidisoli]|uniref:glycoside hydrolase family 88/105 protein n=1 Tax=Pedobacter frigidisoli TaxID=2530455 RepID=UPI002930EA1F|nr:glycoside hydrolase family 88 protein [Pedobacter frigidisoli]